MDMQMKPREGYGLGWAICWILIHDLACSKEISPAQSVVFPSLYSQAIHVLRSNIQIPSNLSFCGKEVAWVWVGLGFVACNYA